MADLAALIARVEAASGPDRVLNGDLLAHFFGDIDGVRAAFPHSSAVPDLTASIDAALALVERLLPDIVIDLCSPNRWAEEDKYLASITPQQQPFPVELDIFAEAPTFPLAILAALLKALQARAGQ